MIARRMLQNILMKFILSYLYPNKIDLKAGVGSLGYYGIFIVSREIS